MIYLSGFADEASENLAGQIATVKELGWSYIEARSIDGVNIHDLDDGAFDAVCETLDREGIRINCFGSTIANWGKDVDEDFSKTMKTVERAIVRMKRLGVSMVRIMSYAILLDEAGRPKSDQKSQKRITRLGEICARFASEGIVPVHENCFNYGGMSWNHTLELLDAIPSMRLVFDTGNPGLTPDLFKPFPYPNQDVMDAWTHLKPYVVHIHVKDGWRDQLTGKETYVYPGEGPCRVEEILADCVASGYKGWLTIEPHMAVVFHDVSVRSPEAERRAIFVEYGRRLESMLRRLGLKVDAGSVSHDDKQKGR